ncbi:MAG: hypothetical protein H7061_02020 [Bdellovibrionaceae bacterium]|nr:hypothetical protein [Bdellovibrio sp.]
MVKLTSLFIIIAIGASSLIANAADIDVMEQARQNFAKGNFDKAIELYSTIPASSDFWLDAIEERAWSNTRLSQYEKALADLHSVTSTVWSSQVGPETYMLSTFVSLKICAFKDVVKKMDIFKKRMLPRVDALETLVLQPVPKEFWEMSEAIKRGQLTMAALGQNAQKYPRYFYRDRELVNALKANANAKATARLKKLASQDLKEIETNLKKMKIIEVEMIQKVLLADKDQKNSKDELNFSKIDRDKTMVFPVTDEEVWIDEVGHFQVKTDLCQSLTGKKL